MAEGTEVDPQVASASMTWANCTGHTWMGGQRADGSRDNDEIVHRNRRELRIIFINHSCSTIYLYYFIPIIIICGCRQARGI